MCMMLTDDCPCCRKWLKTGDLWHCRDCWNRYHNGLRDKDWLPRELWEKMHPDTPKPIDCEKIISDFKRKHFDQKEREAENRVRKAIGKRMKRNDKMEQPDKEEEADL